VGRGTTLNNFISQLRLSSQEITPKSSKGLYFLVLTFYISIPSFHNNGLPLQAAAPKVGRSVIKFASSPTTSDRQPFGSTTCTLNSTVGQYSRTEHTNTVTIFHHPRELYLSTCTRYSNTTVPRTRCKSPTIRYVIGARSSPSSILTGTSPQNHTPNSIILYLHSDESTF
jgi:hypothetical protein